MTTLSRIRAAVLAVCVSLPACDAHGPAENEVPDPSGQPQLTFAVTAGWVRGDSAVIDGTTGRIRVYCLTSRPRRPGCRDTPDRESTLSPSTVRDLFLQTREAAFLRARSSYDTTPIPDAPGYTVTITRAGTTRTINWSFDASLDPSVRRFVAALKVAAGLGG